MSVCDDKKIYVFEDSKRPALPYVAGACFEIKRHKRLTPFDSGIRYEFPKVCSLSDPLLPSDVLPPSEILDPRDNLTPWRWSPSKPSQIAPGGTITERYLRHRPRKTQPHDGDKTVRRLEIVCQIRVRDGAYAQVVQCRVDGIRGLLVAKIFDPLYRWEDVALDEPQSPVGLAESEWSREAAAYARTRNRGLDGRYTPRFEGCWSFDIPYDLGLELASNSAPDDASTATATTSSGSQSEKDGETRRRGSLEGPTRRTIKMTRNVRLLLMEWIPGDSILHLLETGAYRDIPPDVRMDLLARVGEAQSALWHILVSQGDPHSRNVVVGKYEVHDEADTGDDAKQKGHQPSFSCGVGMIEERPRKQRKRQERSAQKWRIALIDFGKSVVLDLPNAVINLKGWLPPALPRPPNPMTRCRGSWPIQPLQVKPEWDDAAPEEEANWIDNQYRSFEARRNWMEARWGKGSARAHQYQPVEYDELDNRFINEK
jgi:hypothetical protein